MIQYLLRGSSPSDKIYGFIPCCVYNWFAMSMHKLTRTTWPQRNDIDSKLILWLLRINGNHWVLVVVVNAISVLRPSRCARAPSCVLYFDPLQKHRSSCQTTVQRGVSERETVHRNVLKWFNYNVGRDGAPHSSQSLPMLFKFEIDGVYWTRIYVYSSYCFPSEC